MAVVMVVVAAAAEREDIWDIVSINRTQFRSFRYSTSCNEKVTCPMKDGVGMRSPTDKLNGYVNCDTLDIVNDCDVDTYNDVCSCGCESLINGFVDYSKTRKPRMRRVIHIHTEGVFFATCLREIQRSLVYRSSVMHQWTSIWRQKYIKTNSTDVASVKVKVKIHDTIPYVVDYAWGERMCRCVLERQHLDTLMSWLSTLGGACSALGDQLHGFAERAWAISIHQLEIARRLGDPNIESRCKLYAAISLIQQCQFKFAARLIKQEYLWVHTIHPEVRDTRLARMCQGIWTKLKHERMIYYQTHSRPSFRTIKSP